MRIGGGGIGGSGGSGHSGPGGGWLTYHFQGAEIARSKEVFGVVRATQGSPPAKPDTADSIEMSVELPGEVVQRLTSLLPQILGDSELASYGATGIEGVIELAIALGVVVLESHCEGGE